MTELNREQQAQLTAGQSMWETAAIAGSGIPSIKLADGPMGLASGRVDERDVSILSPCPTALGASWDVNLVARVGAMIGGEAARLGVDAVLAPNINLARSPLSGRAFEYFSEDPLLAGVIGVAWSSGLQSTGVGSVAKHLVCNDSETQRDTLNAVVDERSLREVYLLPFELAAAAGVGGMLTAYNRVNGEWNAEQGHVISDIVKGEWQFPGVIMSDWFGTRSTVGCLNGGLDLEMPGPGRFLGAKSLEAVSDGRVAPKRLADAADRVATFARRFAGPKQAASTPEEIDELLIESAAAGFVLLRNQDDILPLDSRTAGTIAVIGPNAAAPCFQGGTFAKIAVRPDAISPLQAIRDRFGATATVIYEPGADPQPRLPSMPVSPARDLGDGCTVGMTIDYFGDKGLTGPPLGSETRATNSLVWFAGLHALGAWDRAAGVRASGRFRPKTGGEHVFYLGGTGAVAMRVDGVEILRNDRQVASSDVMGVLKSGESIAAAVALTGDRDVLVEVDFTYDQARAQGLWFGIREPDSAVAMLARAVDAATRADTVFLIIGETSDSSVESKDRTDTKLVAEQLALIEAVTAANPRTVAVVNVGHAFDAGWQERTAALMIAWYPGQEFGRALAQVLAGDREPGGRMPVSIARRESDYPAFSLDPQPDGNLPYTDGVGIGYRSLNSPLHAFGSGSGYARFTIEDARIEDGTILVGVHNHSDRSGSDVIQVYRHEPELALVGFAKIELPPRTAGEVRIAPEPRLFRTWNDGWTMPGGAVELAIGRSSRELPIRLQFDLELIPRRDSDSPKI